MISDAYERFAAYLKWSFRLSPADVEITQIPGYWRIKTPCRGAGACSSPLHSCLFHAGPIHHTVSFFDPGRDERGRFSSPCRTWAALRAQAANQAERKL